ncbi:hypothetical protein CDAR_433031 [Caerostris darwini]|uniref:Uncharacterized protein n=1 Tax=Caerostris darwini TaxID=1538125 RepID=A0AAV4QKH1_9ARAC|nr:hypothetical protein CDAR_433031 [Caerostris darwini]
MGLIRIFRPATTLLCVYEKWAAVQSIPKNTKWDSGYKGTFCCECVNKISIHVRKMLSVMALSSLTTLATQSPLMGGYKAVLEKVDVGFENTAGL